MNWVDEAISEYGRQLGLADLRLNMRGVVRLDLGDELTLTLEPVTRRDQLEILVCLGRHVGHEAPLRALQAMRRAHALQRPRVDVQAALSGTGAETCLIVATRIGARSLMPHAISHAADTLARWLDAVMESGDIRA